MQEVLRLPTNTNQDLIDVIKKSNKTISEREISSVLMYLQSVRQYGNRTVDNEKKMEKCKFLSDTKLILKIKQIGLTPWENQRSTDEMYHDEKTAPINYQNLLSKEVILKLTDAYTNGKEGKEIRNVCIQMLNIYCARVFETTDANKIKSVYKQMSTRMLLKIINENGELNQQLKSSGVNAAFKPITAPTNAAYRISRALFTTGQDNDKTPQQKKSRHVKFNCPSEEEDSELDNMLRSYPASTGEFSQPRDIDDQKQNILNHFRTHYRKMDKTTLMRALNQLTDTAISDLVTDQNSMHNFGLGVGQTTRFNQYGTDGNASNMVKAYTIEVINPKASIESIGKTTFAAVLNEAIALEHVLTLQPTNRGPEQIIAPGEYPRRGPRRRMYQQEQEDGVKITVNTSMDLIRFFDPKDEFCRSSMNRVRAQIEATDIKVTEVPRQDVERRYLLNNSHPTDSINRTARELRTACQMNTDATYNPSSVTIQLEQVTVIGGKGEASDGVKILTLSVDPNDEGTIRCIENFRQTTVTIPEKTRSRLTILEVILSHSEEMINPEDDEEVEIYNSNIKSQQTRMEQMKEVTIEGLPDRASLDDELSVSNKRYTLGEFAMDSAEARKQNDGEHSLDRRIAHTQICQKGGKTVMTIYGNEKDHEFMQIYAKSTIIPALIMRWGPDRVIRIEGSKVETEQKQSKEESELSELSEMKSMMKQLIKHNENLLKHNENQTRKIDDLRSKVYKLTKTVNIQSKTIEQLTKREMSESSEFIGKLKQKEYQMETQLDNEVESIRKLEVEHNLNNSEWYNTESDIEVDPLEKRKMHHSLDRIRRDSTFFNESSVNQTLFRTPRGTSLSPVKHVTEKGEAKGGTDEETSTINGSESGTSDDEEESVNKLKTQPDETSPAKLQYGETNVTETTVGRKRKTKSKTKSKTPPKKRGNESSEMETDKQENTVLKNNGSKRKTRSRK